MRACTVIALIILMDSCSIFYGCDSDNSLVTLSERTRQWAPYFEGQELIFENESVEAVVQVLEHRDTIEMYERGDECPEAHRKQSSPG